MTHETRDLTLVSALKELFSDLSDLVKKELRLARAEMTESVKAGLQAGIWMAAAGVLGLIAALLVIQAIVFGLASLGLGVGWASLIVAVVLGIAAAAAFFYGRSLARDSLRADRTVRQINRDITAVREQLT
jgi:VIT1/CCC1 family predicted Fe2+/Mn2+ transporter